MRRGLIVLLVTAGVVAALGYLFRAPLVKRVIERVATQRIAAPPIPELPDGLHVVLCGAGGPLPDPVRSGPCVGIVANGKLYVVDAGSGGARNLQTLGYAPGAIEALFLTHFHSDHIDGLGELALQRWAGAARTTPMPVVGPIGVEQVVDGFNTAYTADFGYRVAHHGEETVPPSGAGLEAVPFPEPADGNAPVVWEDGNLKVTAFRVEHAPVSPAVGYRFDYAGRSVLVSGDTKRSENLLRFAKDVDLLVHEALAEKIVAIMNRAATSAGRTNVAKITSDIPDYHTPPAEAAGIAEAAGAGHLLFYHVVPPLPAPGMEAVFLEGVADAYSGPVTVGRDGTAVSLPAGSDRIEVSQP
ncbi:MAG: MBL fold metallo-hydrolase [Myxococcales bacterium]|nr:MBL fold metallo-hydrolase [Myxococcales bacterium]